MTDHHTSPHRVDLLAPSDEPKTCIRLWIGEYDLALIDDAAKSLQLTRAEFIRQCATVEAQEIITPSGGSSHGR